MRFNRLSRRTKILYGSAVLAATAATCSVPALAASDADAAKAFYADNYRTKCDTLFLAEYWQNSPGQAKIQMGYKIIEAEASGEFEATENTLQEARTLGKKKGVHCEFSDADNPAYSHKDIALLAAHWKVGRIDVKDRIVKKIENGQNQEVYESLKSAAN